MSSWQVYADQLLYVLGFFMLVASLLIVVPHLQQKQEDGIHPKAEYLVVLTWDDQRDVDLDLWLKHDNCIVYFRAKECVNINLDRDSLGYSSNSQTINNKLVISPNQEVIAIRAVIPGDFLVAVNYFGGKDSVTGEAYRHMKPDPKALIDCTVELIKVNPKVETVSKVTLHFDRQGASQNAINWHVNEDGSVEIRDLPPESMIGEYLHDQSAAAGANSAL